MPLSSSFMDAVPRLFHSVAITCFPWSSFPLCHWTYNTVMQLLYYFSCSLALCILPLQLYYELLEGSILYSSEYRMYIGSWDSYMCVTHELYFPYWSYIFDITLAFIQGHKEPHEKHFNMPYKLPKALFIMFNVLLHKSHKTLNI